MYYIACHRVPRKGHEAILRLINFCGDRGNPNIQCNATDEIYYNLAEILNSCNCISNYDIRDSISQKNRDSISINNIY